MDSCIKRHIAKKYQFSAKEVKRWYISICLHQLGLTDRKECEERAEEAFRGDDRHHPSGLRRVAKIVNRRFKTTSRALVRGVKRNSRGAWSWAKSIVNRPAAFQNSVREEEGVGAMHPIRPIPVLE
ncbi:MAG: hypothetical protein M1826_003784 [Phylliscum demangeonii]|nr:MAG: hypothetical protein M1826_003784 [Phylliscum demangeonii]